MAEIIKNNKNFLIIKLNNEEATKLNFGIFRKDGDIFICDSCNVICNNSNMYYVASINDILCEDCMNDFIENMNHYIDDNSLKYEVANLYTAPLSGMPGRRILTSIPRYPALIIEDFRFSVGMK